MKERVYIFLLMIVGVPIAGELNFHPFGDTFRVSFGTTAFLFFLLWIKNIPPWLSGFAVGISVFSFRILLDLLGRQPIHVEPIIYNHLPALVFYVCYAALFSLMRINQLYQRPLLVGLLGVVIEVISNLMELTFRWAPIESVMSLEIISKITLFAVIRTFFVLGFFNMIQLRHAIILEEQQRKRNERTMLLISDLYVESIQLKKTLNQVESITRDCYDVYRGLQASSNEQAESYAKRVLHIAGQVHEIKKDNQRIYAGLSKMISSEDVPNYMSMEALGRIVVRSNQKYAQLLAKEISFELQVVVTQGNYHMYTLLSLMNNLVANAVEAIKEAGTIRITIKQLEDWLEVSVHDDGPGVLVKDKEILFKPGFTTKYDISGMPSTGIGLSYVKEMVESLGGTITVENEAIPRETVFTIRLPIESIIHQGG
ncbi:ATP-binding protein [Brevibacillus ginsengisoli]|uniref:ATP-binding protein n=1 Tax=Brevibacillus ginsengisoli TaxID=363854 RepID=UPI003CF64CC1